MVTYDEIKKDSPKGKFVYVIEGNPVALARHRYGRGHMYDIQKNHKLMTGIILDGIHGSRERYSGALALDITFYLPIAGKNNIEKRHGAYHVQRPDLSNLIKFYEDVATGILYDDDCIIVDICARKRWDKAPRTEFSLTRLS